MATLQDTLSIDFKYTTPNLVTYQLYKGGIFEGYGDISYCLLKFGACEMGKYKFYKESYIKNKALIHNFISFIGYSYSDSISCEEMAFVKSREYGYLSYFLENTRIKFNADFSELYFEHHKYDFTKEDIDKSWSDFYHCTRGEEDLVSIWDDKNNSNEELYVGGISIQRGQKHIDIPVIRPNIKKVELLRINANVDIHKCLLFIGKLNALYYYLYENRYSNYVFWDGNFIANNYNIQNKLSKFNYFKII